MNNLTSILSDMATNDPALFFSFILGVPLAIAIILANLARTVDRHRRERHYRRLKQRMAQREREARRGL